MWKAVRIISLFVILFLLNCEENPTESDNSGFNLTIIVADKNSNKLSDVNVSIWNKIQSINSYLPKILDLSEIHARTSIEFSLKQKCSVSLKVCDLEGNILSTMINNEILNAGTYSYQYLNNSNIRTGVFKCKLSLKEDSLSNSKIFSDSIYCFIISPNPENGQIGSTNDKGEFSTSNKLLFPNLYELPELVLTSEAGSQEIGRFNISDEIILALTKNSETKYFDKIISEGSNKFNLIWEDGSAEYPGWEVRNIGSNILKSKEKKIIPTNVILSYFEANREESIIKLKWGTTSEINNYGFEIERKNNDWQKIGFVAGHGNSDVVKNYSFEDKSNLVGIIKYRLKQLDINGEYNLLDSVFVGLEIPNENKLYQNYPNPFN